MNNILIAFLAVLSFACLSPEEIDYSADAEVIALDQLLDQSLVDQQGYQIDKEVILDGEKETFSKAFDTLVLQNDLSSLNDVAFSRLIRSASYNLTTSGNQWTYERKDGENKGPVVLSIWKSNQSISNVVIKYREKNVLYESVKRIELWYQDNRLSKYKIEGSRKLMGMDSSSYSIVAEISKI